MVSLGIHGQPKSMWHSLRGSTSHITISLSLPISNVARHCLSTFNFVLVIHTTWYKSRGNFTFNPNFFTASLDIALVQLPVSITKEHICSQLAQVWKIFPLSSFSWMSCLIVVRGGWMTPIIPSSSRSSSWTFTYKLALRGSQSLPQVQVVWVPLLAHCLLTYFRNILFQQQLVLKDIEKTYDLNHDTLF